VCDSHRRQLPQQVCSSDENAGTTGLLDSLLSGLGEELGLDDHGDLGQDALAEDLEVALKRGEQSAATYRLGDIDHGGLVLASLGLGSSLF
jgi:hypothetical protein